MIFHRISEVERKGLWVCCFFHTSPFEVYTQVQYFLLQLLYFCGFPIQCINTPDFHSPVWGSFSFYALLSLSRHSMNHILTHIVPFCTILSFQSDSSLTKYVKFVKATMLFFKRMYFLIWLTSRAMYPLNFNKIFGFVKYFEVHTNKLKV